MLQLNVFNGQSKQKKKKTKKRKENSKNILKYRHWNSTLGHILKTFLYNISCSRNISNFFFLWVKQHFIPKHKQKHLQTVTYRTRNTKSLPLFSLSSETHKTAPHFNIYSLHPVPCKARPVSFNASANYLCILPTKKDSVSCFMQLSDCTLWNYIKKMHLSALICFK